LVPCISFLQLSEFLTHWIKIFGRDVKRVLNTIPFLVNVTIINIYNLVIWVPSGSTSCWLAPFLRSLSRRLIFVKSSADWFLQNTLSKFKLHFGNLFSFVQIFQKIWRSLRLRLIVSGLLHNAFDINLKFDLKLARGQVFIKNIHLVKVCRTPYELVIGLRINFIHLLKLFKNLLRILKVFIKNFQ